ncbi:MAG: outer-membrane lipoprotein carrier protein LolA [Beijerinckiaceae bacterium]
MRRVTLTIRALRESEEMMKPFAIRAAVALSALMPGATAAMAQSAKPLQLAPSAAAPAKPAAGAKSAAAFEPMEQIAIVTTANDYFNTISGMTADFTQIGADGKQFRGKLYVQKPGKMRFEYNPPAVIEVVSDGSSVVVRDRKLATQDMYTIGQTPLKFLLKDQVNLARDTKLLRTSHDTDSMALTVEDKSTFGGTSRVTLVFNSDGTVLKNWRVRDPQGHETFVSLSNINLNAKPEAARFRIDYQRVLPTGSN